MNTHGYTAWMADLNCLYADGVIREPIVIETDVTMERAFELADEYHNYVTATWVTDDNDQVVTRPQREGFVFMEGHTYYVRANHLFMHWLAEGWVCLRYVVTQRRLFGRVVHIPPGTTLDPEQFIEAWNADWRERVQQKAK